MRSTLHSRSDYHFAVQVSSVSGCSSYAYHCSLRAEMIRIYLQKRGVLVPDTLLMMLRTHYSVYILFFQLCTVNTVLNTFYFCWLMLWVFEGFYIECVRKQCISSWTKHLLISRCISSIWNSITLNRTTDISCKGHLCHCISNHFLCIMTVETHVICSGYPRKLLEFQMEENMCQKSSVSKVTAYGLDDQSCIPKRVRDFSV